MGAGASNNSGKTAKYMEYDSNNKLVEREVTLSHSERFKTMGRRDANGKVILGIHTNLFHKVRSKTLGGGKNDYYGPGNPHGPGKDKYGRKLSPLELMRREERDRQRRVRLEDQKPIVRFEFNIFFIPSFSIFASLTLTLFSSFSLDTTWR